MFLDLTGVSKESRYAELYRVQDKVENAYDDKLNILNA